MRKFITGLRGRAKALCRLRLEPLESRTVLSAISPMAPVFQADQPEIAPLSNFADAGSIAKFAEVTHDSPERVPVAEGMPLKQIAVLGTATDALGPWHGDVASLPMETPSDRPQISVPLRMGDRDLAQAIRSMDATATPAVAWQPENHPQTWSIDNGPLEKDSFGKAGLAAIESNTLAVHYRAIDQTFVSGVELMPLRFGEKPDRTGAPHDFVLLQRIHLNSPPTPQEESGSASSPPGPDQTSKETNLPLEGSLVDNAPPPVRESQRIDRSVGKIESMPRSSTTNGSNPVHEPGTTGNEPSSFAVTNEEKGKTAGSTPDGSRAAMELNFANGHAAAASSPYESVRTVDRLNWGGAEHAGSAIPAEGGFVEILSASEASPPSFGRAKQNPSPDSEERDPAESIATDSDDRGESHVAADDKYVLEESHVSENALPDSSQAFDSVEGGMIELATVSSSPANLSAVADVPGLASEGLSPGAREVRMDNGVGLFRAFELAAAPTDHLGEVVTVSEDSVEIGLPSETTSPSPSDAAPAEAVSVDREMDQQPLHRAGILPTMAITSLLVAVDAFHLEEKSSQHERRRPSVRNGR